MDDQQKATRELVERMLTATSLDPTQLAKRAGLSPSTLTRFLNQPVKHTLSARTLAKLSAASGVPVPLASAAPQVEEVKPARDFAQNEQERIWLDLWRKMPAANRMAVLASLLAVLPTDRDDIG